MGKPPLKVLIRALKHNQKRTRMVAAWTLGQLGDVEAVEPLIAALADADKQVAGSAVHALVKIGEPAVVPLIDSLRPGVNQPWPRAATVLVKIGEPAVLPLIKALNDRGEHVRILAIGVLGWIGDVRAIEPLIRCLFRDREHVRALAAMSLVKIGEPAVEPLLGTLCGDNQQVWMVGANALKLIGPPAVEPLIAALGHRYDQVRILAATVLGWIGDKRAVVPLQAVMVDPNTEVYEAAAEALARLGQEPAFAY